MMLLRGLKVASVLIALLAGAPVQAASDNIDPGSEPPMVDAGFAANSDTPRATETASNEIATLPLPAALWLFGGALVAFIGFSRRRTPH